MSLGDDYLPIRKIGYLSPLAVIDNGPYEFYKIAPPRVMYVLLAVGLEEFSAQDVDRVYANVEQLTLQLVERGVDIVFQGGVPLPILIGRPALLQLLERIGKAGNVKTGATVLSVVEAAKGLGLKRIAAANKWTESMNANLADFFAAGGVEMIGAATKVMGPADFQKMTSESSMQLAYELGKAAFEQYPDCDGVYIGGGAWLMLPVITKLEEEYGKPVITNHTSVIWDACRRLECWQPKPGHGRLIATP